MLTMQLGFWLTTLQWSCFLTVALLVCCIPLIVVRFLETECDSHKLEPEDIIRLILGR